MATDEWQQLRDWPDTERAYGLLDLAQVRVRRVPAIVIPDGRDSQELRDCLRRVGLSCLPVVVDHVSGHPDKQEKRKGEL